MDKKKIVLFVLLILLLLGFYLMQAKVSPKSSLSLSQVGEITESQKVIDKPEIEQKTVASDSVLPYKSKYGPLPGSLDGTVMQQALVVDDEGNLRISTDLKRVFDFFLSTIEEEDLEVILGRIREYLEFSLQEPALSQANEMMAQYVALKKALYDFEVERSESLKNIMAQGAGIKGEAYLSLLKEQLEAQRDLRSLHLSPEMHDAFYAEEERYDRYSLARMEVKANTHLSEAQKQARLAEIDDQAPSDIVESRRASQITDILKEKTQALVASGASQTDIRALRADMLGEEAADRFDALDQERASWNARIEGYLDQRKMILNNDGLSEDAKQEQVSLLRQRNFDERERIRLSVYERRSDAVN